MKKLLLSLFLLPFLIFLSSCGNGGISVISSGGGIKLPPGFAIEKYADVPGARSITTTENGIVIVGTRDKGVVYAVVDNNNDMKADEVIVIAEGLNNPNGVAVLDGDLYVAEISRILKFVDIENNYRSKPQYQVVFDDYPTDKHHGWKFIRFGLDGKLYVPVGAPCNVCYRDEEIYSTITRLNPDGTDFEIFAHGVRNTVGFDWHPETNELWFTDNGRDLMGDNIPPDELNRASQPGQHFGFPFFHGNDIKDPEYAEGKKPTDYVRPVQTLGPHVAALGMRFYTGTMFPEDYRNQIFIAERGSWNRSEKIGYRVTLVRLEGNKAVSYEPFAEGWLQGESVSGRPVDVEVMQDGSLLVSDDFAGMIYRISYKGKK
jgi:glucose/arabinose dehydrogenase